MCTGLGARTCKVHVNVHMHAYDVLLTYMSLAFMSIYVYNTMCAVFLLFHLTEAPRKFFPLKC